MSKQIPKINATLLTYIFDGQPHLLADPVADWLASSRPFVSFVSTYRDKIRKKLRTTADEASLLDVRLELETAWRLLGQQRLSVAYEPQCSQARCPDFAVTYTTSLTFMLEVTRLQAGPPLTTPNPAAAEPLVDERLADAVCSKLSQLLPHGCNVLLIGLETMSLTNENLRATLVHLQQRAEREEAGFLARYGWRKRADFFRYYGRLSEVLVRGPDLRAADALLAWVNPRAKHPLPGKVQTVLYRSQIG